MSVSHNKLLLHSCCTANSAVVPSCTNPLTQTKKVDQQDLCPRPPQVSLDDVQNNSTGRLDSETVFVDETLLRKGTDMSPDVYIRRIQAGFVLSYRDPPYAACACNDVDFFTNKYVNELSECTRAAGAQVFALKRDSEFVQYFDWLSRDCDENTSWSGVHGSSADVFRGDYTVDGMSANWLQLLACVNESFHHGCDGEKSNDRPMAEYYPDQTPQVSATIFYNNNVCISFDTYSNLCEFFKLNSTGL